MVKHAIILCENLKPNEVLRKSIISKVIENYTPNEESYFSKTGSSWKKKEGGALKKKPSERGRKTCLSARILFWRGVFFNNL